MKHLIISLFFLFPFVIQCNEQEPLLQKHRIAENLKSLINKSASYNISINCFLAVLFFGGNIYAFAKNEPLAPWGLALFTYLGMAISQAFLNKTEDVTNQSLPR